MLLIYTIHFMSSLTLGIKKEPPTTAATAGTPTILVINNLTVFYNYLY